MRFIFILIIIFSNVLFAQLNKFEPIEGKFIGIWPHNSRMNDVNKLIELKEKWGFSKILVAEIYSTQIKDNLLNAGYDNSQLFKQIIPPLKNIDDWYLNNIDAFGKIGGYYFDEPISRKFSFVDVSKLIIYLCEKNYYPTSKILISELTDYKAASIKILSDNMLYSGYGKPDKQGEDQIETWINWKNRLGNYFSSTWVSTLLSNEYYEKLFKTAKQLGLNGIWLYALEPLDSPDVSDEHYRKFCELAVKYGFLKYKE